MAMNMSSSNTLGDQSALKRIKTSRESLFQTVQQLNRKKRQIEECSTTDKLDSSTIKRQESRCRYRITGEEGRSEVEYLLYQEDAIGLSRNVQAMLIRSNNDDDNETGEMNARKAKVYCMNETIDGIGDREKIMEKKRAQEEEEQGWGEEESLEVGLTDKA